MFSVYLAGSIEDVSEEEAHGWRDKVFEHLEHYSNVEIFDPSGREQREIAAVSGTNRSSRITITDLRMIEMSDVIIADCRNSSPGNRWGTMMEIGIAYKLGKVIIGVLDPGYRHPFLDTILTETHMTFSDATQAALAYRL